MKYVMNYTHIFKGMKKSIFILVAAVITTVFACNNSANHSHSHDNHSSHAHDFACPMHPEIDGHEGDKCSKCGMPLEKIKQVNETKFRMDIASEPAQIEAGKEVTIQLKPINLSNESALVPLDVVHEKKIHLIAVSEDLSEFYHLHPEYNANGNYEMKMTFPSGGNYILYADYQPSGATHQLEKKNIVVSGKPQPAQNFEASKLTSTDNGVALTLRSGSGSFKTNQMLHIDGILTKDGAEIDASTLDNYLGTKAHIVLINMNDKSYEHIHADVEGKVLHMHTDLSTPGIYRAWIQFMYKGKLHTTDFVIDVEQGDANDNDRHSHDGHDHNHQH